MSAKLRRLEAGRYLTLKGSEPVQLTASGKRLAEELLRRQRLAELLLTGQLGLSWADAHVTAQSLKHAITQAMEDRLIEVLGSPTRSPFGYPIPGAGEGLRPTTNLREVRVDASVEVECVLDSDPALLRVFEEERIAPGATLAVLAHDEARGTLTLKAGRRESVLGLTVAEQVWVREL